MFIRPCYKKTNGKKLAYWALVESYCTAKGPRQRVVAYLGQLKDVTRRGIKRIAEEKGQRIVEGKNTPEGQDPSDNKSKPQFVQARLFNNDQLNNNQLEAEFLAFHTSIKRHKTGMLPSKNNFRIQCSQDFESTTSKKQEQHSYDCRTWAKVWSFHRE